MLKTYLYIPDEIHETALRIVKKTNQSKATVLRIALEIGLKKQDEENNNSAASLLRLAEIGKKYNEKGPTDLSQNMDHYLWDFKKK